MHAGTVVPWLRVQVEVVQASQQYPKECSREKQWLQRNEKEKPYFVQRHIEMGCEGTFRNVCNNVQFFVVILLALAA